MLIADAYAIESVLAECSGLDNEFLRVMRMCVDHGDGNAVLVKLRDQRGDATGQAGAAAQGIVVAHLAELQAAVADMHGRTQCELEQTLDAYRSELLPGVNRVNIHVDVDMALIEPADVVPVGRVCNRRAHLGELISHECQVGGQDALGVIGVAPLHILEPGQGVADVVLAATDVDGTPVLVARDAHYTRQVLVGQRRIPEVDGVFVERWAVIAPTAVEMTVRHLIRPVDFTPERPVVIELLAGQRQPALIATKQQRIHTGVGDGLDDGHKAVWPTPAVVATPPLAVEVFANLVTEPDVVGDNAAVAHGALLPGRDVVIDPLA